MQGGQQESRWWEHLERVLSLSGATREADVGGNSRGKRFLGKKKKKSLDNVRATPEIGDACYYQEGGFKVKKASPLVIASVSEAVY